MVSVNKSQVSLINGKLIGEASTMGLAVGEWPDFISVVDDKNEGFLFMRGTEIHHSGEFGGFNYRTQNAGIEMVVFND